MDRPTRILIIEDNEDVRENLSEILELYGYETMTAADGLSGAKLAIQDPPDLILCDVMMPELDGFGVLNLLTEHDQVATVPFIFITARTESEDIRRGMNLGADDYITKPFYKDELLQVIQTRLRKAITRQSAAAGTSDTAPRLDDPERGRGRLRESFAEDGSRRVFEPGTAIVREDEHPHFVYQIEEGRVHLSRTHDYGRDYILTELGPGEWFGMPSVLERKPLHYTARAATERVTVQQLPRDTFLDLVNRERSVSDALIHILADQLVHRSEQLVNQAYDSVRRRTALVLCDLHDRHPQGGISLSREELAQMVGSTKESVTRALSEFKKDGLVSTDGRTIRVLRAKTLRGLLV
jgi:CRP-like cAMP-binding protein/CheY-like chemotaxis protein